MVCQGGDVMEIKHLSPSSALPPGAYMSAETKYDLEKDGVLNSDWTYEPLAYRGLPVTLHEDVPSNTLWIVGDLRDAIVDALRKLPEDTTWGIPVRDGGTSNTLVSVLDEFAPSSPEVVAAFSEGAPALVDVFAVFDRLADFQPPSKEAIDAFALRALDMACARALGTHIRPEDIEANNHRRVFPPYSSDLTTARLLEDEVKRSGLAHEYAAALYGIVTHHYLTHEGATPDEIVLLVFATPKQRARAFLEVAKKND